MINIVRNLILKRFQQNILIYRDAFQFNNGGKLVYLASKKAFANAW